jgi:hypothetical protein
MCGSPSPPRHEEVLELGSLPGARSDGRADISDRIPTLDVDQPMLPRQCKPDVGRSPLIDGLRRELEATGVPGGSSDPKHQLLQGEVAGISGLVRRTAATEGDDERSTKRDRDPLKRLEVGVPDAALDPTLDHPADARPPGELGSRQASSLAVALDLRTDSPVKLADEALGLDRECWSSDARHDRHMFIPGSSPRLTRAAATAGARTGRAMATLCARRGHARPFATLPPRQRHE